MASIVRLNRGEKVIPIRLSFITEFTNLIEQKIKFSRKKKEFSFAPNDPILQIDEQNPVNKNCRPPDQDFWDEKAQTKEFARRRFGK